MFSVCCWQWAGDAAVYGSEQPSAVPDDLRQDDNSETARQAQQTERPDGDQQGGAQKQTRWGVDPLDHTL